MTTEVLPVSKKVKDAMNRQTSPRRHIAPAAGFLLRLVMFLLIVGGCIAGVFVLWQLALLDSRFRMDGETLSMAGALRECPESMDELEAIGRTFSGRSLLDPSLITDMEGAYGKSVWVKRVVQMRRRFPNRIELEFLLRMPVAQVWCDNRYWMIDGEATLLPLPGAEKPYPDLPEIVGVTAQVIGKRPQPGSVWADEGITGALGIMRDFWGSPLAETLPIRRVVVNAGVFKDRNRDERETRRRFEVVALNDVVIRWGLYGGGEGELSSAEKLWSLQDLLRRKTALRPGVCFDVRTKLPGYSLLD